MKNGKEWREMGGGVILISLDLLARNRLDTLRER